MAANKNKPVFLDVDSNILEKNLTLDECKSSEVDDYKALFGLNTKDGDQPWKLVTPEPGFCVKTYDGEKKKAFVNFCILKEIPEPRDISEEELLRLIEAEDGSDFRVPLSLQEPHEEVDKAGKPAVCYDVAINPKFYEKIEKSPGFRLFLLQVTFDGIKDKFDVDLDVEGHVILKNRKAVGVLRPHRIRTSRTPSNPKKPLVEEITAVSPIQTAPNSVKSAKYRFYSALLNNEVYLYGEVHLPKVVSSSEINLEVGGDRIIVECHKSQHFLDVFFPLQLDQNFVNSQFSTASRILQIWAPILSM